jgi:hypothetical protein
LVCTTRICGMPSIWLGRSSLGRSIWRPVFTRCRRCCFRLNRDLEERTQQQKNCSGTKTSMRWTPGCRIGAFELSGPRIMRDVLLSTMEPLYFFLDSSSLPASRLVSFYSSIFFSFRFTSHLLMFLAVAQ